MAGYVIARSGQVTAPPGDVCAWFSGKRVETAPLTWGQQGIWKAVRSLAPEDHVLNLRQVLTVSERAALSPRTLARAVGDLIGRHQALRTRIRTAAGVPRQVTAERGQLRIPVLETSVEQVAAAADEMLVRQAETTFDHAEELPLRVGVVTAGGWVRRVAVVFSHLAVDRYAADLLLRELRLLWRGPLRTAPGMQPVDLARRQAAVGARRTRRVVDHWAAAYQRIPLEPFGPAGPGPARHSQAKYASRALGPAVARIARRCRVSTSTVLLAGTSALLGRLTGHHTVGLLAAVSNRFQPGHDQVVSPMNQIALFALELDGWDGFDDLVARTSQAALAAYRYGYYDQEALDLALRDEVGRGYGAAETDPYCGYNDHRLAVIGGAPPAVGWPGDRRGPGDVGQPGALGFATEPDEAAVRAALADSVFEWNYFEPFHWRFYLDVLDVPGGTGVWLVGDNRYLSPDAIERFVRDLERLVVDAAFGPVRPADLAGRVDFS